MNNILNKRVKMLIKNDLLAYGQYLLSFLGFLILSIIINLLFGASGVVDIRIGIFEGVNIAGILNLISFSVLAVTMGISGIGAGTDLPQYVRRGIARTEYFIAITVSAIIVSLLIGPFMMFLNTIINLFATSESVFYNAFHIGGGDVSILAVQFLIYMALFLIGFFVTLFLQRVGWYIGAAVIVGVFIILNLLDWSIVNWLNIFNITTGDNWFELEWSFSNGFFGAGVMAVVLIVIFGIGTYTLIKNLPVKTK